MGQLTFSDCPEFHGLQRPIASVNAPTGFGTTLPPNLLVNAPVLANKPLCTFDHTVKEGHSLHARPVTYSSGIPATGYTKSKKGTTHRLVQTTEGTLAVYEQISDLSGKKGPTLDAIRALANSDTCRRKYQPRHELLG